MEELQQQLAGWVSSGIPRVKMKIGTDPKSDPDRVRMAREAVGPDAELFVDANGAYARKQALAMAQQMSGVGVSRLLHATQKTIGVKTEKRLSDWIRKIYNLRHILLD